MRRTLVVLATQEEVRVLDGLTEVARHRRSYDAGSGSRIPPTSAALVAHKQRAREHRGIDRLALAAPCHPRCSSTDSPSAARTSGTPPSSCFGCLDTYGAAALEHAVTEVLGRDVPHVHAVGQVLEREQAAKGRPPATPLSLPDDARIQGLVVRPHDLEGYDALAQDPPTPEPEERGTDEPQSEPDQ